MIEDHSMKRHFRVSFFISFRQYYEKESGEKMALEIERKFIVYTFDESLATGEIHIIQGYIKTAFKGVVRVRTWNEKAYLTIKYRLNRLTREEFEYEIPFKDALKLLKNACYCTLDKTRFLYPYQNKIWEIDRFNDRDLILAEVEMVSEEEKVAIPSFIEREVTDDPRYSNNALCSNGGVPEIR